MTVLAIDPGSERSAWVLYDGETVLAHGIDTNAVMLESCRLGGANPRFGYTPIDHAVIEKIASYGMPVGAEVFDTVFWSGRFWQALYGSRKSLLLRREVKLHLCGQVRAKDSNIRQALIDKFGGKVQTKKGGALYGIKADEWAALALAVTWCETRRQEPAESATQAVRGE